MVNSSVIPNNITLVDSSSNAAVDAIRMAIIVSTYIIIVFFVYFTIVIMIAYVTRPQIRENSRYVLFAHMLINDLVYLILAFYLMMATYTRVYHSSPLCYILVTISSTTFKITPYNLAVMSLERYVAICFPLRHAEFCTRQRSLLAIGVLWVFGLVPNMADFIILAASVEPSYFSRKVLCSRQAFLSNEAQNTLRFLVHVLCFSLVGLIIVFTYIKILLIAMKMKSSKETASKSGKTVMLHAFQLCLCMLAFSYGLTETYIKVVLLPFFNFLFFMCIPRFLSPVVYGLRDTVFSNYLKRFILCKRVRLDISNID